MAFKRIEMENTCGLCRERDSSNFELVGGLVRRFSGSHPKSIGLATTADELEDVLSFRFVREFTQECPSLQWKGFGSIVSKDDRIRVLRNHHSNDSARRYSYRVQELRALSIRHRSHNLVELEPGG